MNFESTRLLVLLLGVLTMAVALAKPANDAKLLEGDWAPTKWTLAGSTTPPPDMAKMKLILKDGQYVFVEGPSVDSGSFTLKADKEPKEMDIVGVKGPNAGRTIPSIYRIKKDQLTICYGLDGHRPSSFDSPKKSMILLIVFSRTTTPKK
jgi:uncharacterized protein (TIGR03067 family)